MHGAAADSVTTATSHRQALPRLRQEPRARDDPNALSSAFLEPQLCTASELARRPTEGEPRHFILCLPVFEMIGDGLAVA
jgi:hypothetical protein